MESENRRLRRQVVDLQYDNTYMRKITEMQAEIISLKQQVIDLKNENIRLISKSSKNKTESSDESDDEEYFTADEGPDNIDRICQYCKQSFKYPSVLRRHLKLKNKCGKQYSKCSK
jgi:aminopeptidase-like protein